MCGGVRGVYVFCFVYFLFVFLPLFVCLLVFFSLFLFGTLIKQTKEYSTSGLLTNLCTCKHTDLYMHAHSLEYLMWKKHCSCVHKNLIQIIVGKFHNQEKCTFEILSLSFSSQFEPFNMKCTFLRKQALKPFTKWIPPESQPSCVGWHYIQVLQKVCLSIPIVGQK